MKKKRVGFVKEVDDNEPSDSSSSSEQSEDEENEELKVAAVKGKIKSQAEIASASITDYEKQRQRRIEENKAKLQALGLPALASSFPHTQSKKLKKLTFQKAKLKQDDNDYQPSTEDEHSDSDSDSSANDETEQKLPSPKKGTPAKRRPPARSKGKKMKSLNSLTVDKVFKECGSLPIYHEKGNSIASQQFELDDDEALQQALALSLEDAASIAEASRQDSVVGKSKAKIDSSELKGKRKAIAVVDKISQGKRKKKQTKNITTIQLTEDEVMAYFFYFDEAGKGKITMRDLERVALAYDFTWSKKELTEMINAFDKDQDGQLGLDDFQTIAERCNMVGGT